MNDAAIDSIVGKTPVFMVRMKMREMAERQLDAGGKWTHIEDLTDAGRRFFDAMVKAGVIEADYKKSSSGVRPLRVYRLKAAA